MRFALALTLTLGAALARPALAAPQGLESGADRTLSPYFVVHGAQPGADALPLASTRADVDIAGPIARVTVTQVYKNAGQGALEALYVFPGSTRAAVYGMRMKVGERVIVAQIQKKDDARKLYEDAKAAGKSASLLEQERPNVFQMSVANILPGDRIEVQLDYTELLVPTDGVYTFVYPAVVGPRYTGESGKAEPFTATAHTHAGAAPSYAWDLAVRVAPGLPIQRLSSSTHRLETSFSALRDLATVKLPAGPHNGTKDFVLDLQLAGQAIQSGVLLLPPTAGKDGYFLAMMQPPAKVAPQDLPKREYVFILDVSGSMHGFPLDVAKQVMDGLFAGLRPEDRFNILFFSGGNRVMSPASVPADAAHVAQARQMLARLDGGGGTELLGALTAALALPTARDYARTFVVVTDGYVSVEPEAFELVRKNLGRASLFAFGIGSSVNRYLIEGLARVGQGEPFFVMHHDDAAQQAAAFTRYIQAPTLTRIQVAFEGFDAFDVEPQAVPDLFASRPVVLVGKYRGAPKGQLRVSGLTGRGPWSQTLDLAAATPSASNVAVRYLWARQRIAALGDLNALAPSDQRVGQITALGLEHGLMTAYTSFIAVDERVRNPNGGSTTVKQPLPLPAGVSDLAVGGPPAEPAPVAVGARSYRTEAKAVAPRPTLSGREYARGRGDRGGDGASAAPAADAKSEDIDAEPPAPPRKAAPTLAFTSVAGTLAQGAVEGVVRARLAALGACFARDAWTGKVTLSLAIGPDGRVTGVTTRADAVLPSGPRACLERLFKAATFPASAGVTAVTLTLSY